MTPEEKLMLEMIADRLSSIDERMNDQHGVLNEKLEGYNSCNQENTKLIALTQQNVKVLGSRTKSLEDDMKIVKPHVEKQKWSRKLAVGALVIMPTIAAALAAWDKIIKYFGV